MIVLLYCLGVLVLLFSLFGIYILGKDDKISNLTYKIEMCENDIDKTLKSKEDTTLSLIAMISNELNIDIKQFEQAKLLCKKSVTNQEKDKILTEANQEIKKIHQDNVKLNTSLEFNETIKDLEKDEMQLVSLRTLYNQCSSEFNSLYTKFPYNLICKFRKKNIKALYEGKELQEVIEKELNNLVI